MSPQRTTGDATPDEIAAAVIEFNQYKLDRLMLSFPELLKTSYKGKKIV